jgi:hypothetical protein
MLATTDAGAGCRVADELHAVPHLQRVVQERPEEGAEQPGHQEQQCDTHAAVAVGGDAELQSDHRGEHDHEGDDGMRHHDARERHADKGADNGRHHGGSQQQVGIAQDPLSLRDVRDVVGCFVIRPGPEWPVAGPNRFELHCFLRYFVTVA